MRSPRQRVAAASQTGNTRRKSTLFAFIFSRLDDGSLLELFDEDGAEIIHVGESRPGNHRVAERREKAVRVVVAQHVLGANAERPSASDRVGSDTAARYLFLTVDPVRIAGQCV